MAASVAGQTQKTLPAKFLKELMVQGRPVVFQLDLTIRDATIASPFPEFASRDVKVIVREIGLQSLHGSCDHLPSVFGFEKKVKSRGPAEPEKMLSALIKSMVDLPHRVDMLKNDGISWVDFVGVHVKDHIN